MKLRDDGALVNGDGQTWDEWAAELFYWEYCCECGGDVEDHKPWVVMDNWFAHCLKEVSEEDLAALEAECLKEASDEEG